MFVRKYIFLIFSLTASFLLVRPAIAQSEARIQIVQTGVHTLYEDLQYLVELSPAPALKQQWKATLEPLLDSFVQGMDPTKPIRVDVIIGKDIGYEMHFPIKKLQGKGSFIENITGLGFAVKQMGPNLFSIVPTKGKKGAAIKTAMFLRHSNGYASIAATEAAVPANLPDPIKAVQTLLDKKTDVVGRMKNTDSQKEMAARKSSFAELRKQLEAAMVFKRNEDKNEFALRKLSLQQNLNEAERFVMETEELLFSWTTTIGAKGMPGSGHGDFSFSALAGTDLFKSTQLLGEKPSYFSNVELGPKPVISGKVNFAIDTLRVGHLKDFYATVRPVVAAQIDKRSMINGEGKKSAAKKAADIFLDMLNDGLALNVADFFLDMQSDGSGKHTLICGARSADGKKGDEIIKLLKDVNADREVKMEIEKIGEASLHSVALLPRRHAAFEKLFAGEKILYVATSKDAVWGAAGADAVAKLKDAINHTAKPAPEKADPRVTYFTAHVGVLMDLAEIARPEPEKNDAALSKEEAARIKQRQKEMDKYRKLASDAFKNCDGIFSGEVKKNGNTVEGSMDVSECVLGLVGAIIADFAKDMQ